VVRDRLRKTPVSDTVGSNWHGGYKLLSLCEYYLLTGDKVVLPAIRGYVRGLEKNQMPTLTISFQSDPAAYTVCRITLPAAIGGELWLNKQCVAIFTKAGRGGLQTLTLGARAMGAMRKGANRWTLRSAELTKPTAFTIGMGPGGASGKAMEYHVPDYGNNNRNGWGASPKLYSQGVAWAFEGKRPREIARYLAYPDGGGARAAYKALALGGDEAFALARQLITDTHVGIRVGAWDTIAEMNTLKLIDAATQTELATLAAKRIATEDPSVGQAMGLAASPMASGDALAQILVGIAGMKDPKARQLAVAVAKKRLIDQPELMVKVMQVVIAAKLNQSDIRLLGMAMGCVSSASQKPAARAAARAAVRDIAGVLDEVSPDMRGMFSDGLMHGGLMAIDQNLDVELEKIPQLVSGLIKCGVKVPDTDWTGWAFANLYFRCLNYRLSAGAADEILRTCKKLSQTIDTEPKEIEQRKLRVQELTGWAGVLKRSGDDPAKLRAEALRLAGSESPNERLIALSMVWPSDVRLGPKGSRFRSAQVMTDQARIQDPKTRLAVAFEAAKHVESNTPTHWLLIWGTVDALKDHTQFDMTPLLAAFFDRVAWRLRGTFMFEAIALAADLASDQLDQPILARGICKNYITSSEGIWYVGCQKKLQALTKVIPAANADAITQAVAAIKSWQKEGSADEKKAVLVRGTSVQQHIAELEALAS